MSRDEGPSDRTEACLRAGLAVLEERVECIAGCGCWEGSDWDEPAAINALARAYGEAWQHEIVAALETLSSLDGEEAESASKWLRGMLHATGHPGREDARTFFARVLGALRDVSR